MASAHGTGPSVTISRDQVGDTGGQGVKQQGDLLLGPDQVPDFADYVTVIAHEIRTRRVGIVNCLLAEPFTGIPVWAPACVRIPGENP